MIKDLDELKYIPEKDLCYIFLNGKKKFFHNKEVINSNIDHIQPWGAFGMVLNTNKSIIKYIESIFPNDIMLLLISGDYHKKFDPLFFNIYPKILQINRYYNLNNNINNSIIIPADDVFFDNYLTYYNNDKCIDLEKRINKVYWRGSNTGHMRKYIVEKYLNNQNFNIKLINNQFSKKKITNERLFDNSVDQYEPYNYTIWLSIEGWGVASDTSRALLSGCAVVYFRETKPWFHKYLLHGHNCCIAENLNDLDTHLNNLLNNKNMIKYLGENAKKISKIIFTNTFMKEYIQREINEKKNLYKY